MLDKLFKPQSVALIGASSSMPLSSVLAVDGLIAIQPSGANTHNSMRKHRIACIFCQMRSFASPSARMGAKLFTSSVPEEEVSTGNGSTTAPS